MSNVSMIDGHIDREERKLTDKEIIKALECCRYDDYDYCEECPYRKNKPCQENLIQDTFDLINRQQAEIERLNIRLRKEQHQFADLGKMYSEIRAEAIKEFAERLKDDSWFTDLFDRNDYPVRAVTKEDIDNVVKEMVGK